MGSESTFSILIQFIDISIRNCNLPVKSKMITCDANGFNSSFLDDRFSQFLCLAPILALEIQGILLVLKCEQALNLDKLKYYTRLSIKL